MIYEMGGLPSGASTCFLYLRGLGGEETCMACRIRIEARLAALQAHSGAARRASTGPEPGNLPNFLPRNKTLSVPSVTVLRMDP